MTKAQGEMGKMVITKPQMGDDLRNRKFARRRQSPYSQRFGLMLIFYLITTTTANVAHAQSTGIDVTPDIPHPLTVREFGVDVSTGAFEYNHADLSVGSGQFPSRLDLMRTYSQSVQSGSSGSVVFDSNGNLLQLQNPYTPFGSGGTFNLLPYFTVSYFNYRETVASRIKTLVNSQSYILNMTINALGKSYHFSATPGTNNAITSTDGEGDTFAILAPQGVQYAEYLLTTHDGIKIYFSDSGAYNRDVVGGLYAKYIEFPDGQFISYSYEPSPSATGVVRLNSLINSNGYGFRFSYYNNNSSNMGIDNSYISNISSIHQSCTNSSNINCSSGVLGVATYNYSTGVSNSTNGAMTYSSGITYANGVSIFLTSFTDSLGDVHSYNYDTNTFSAGNILNIFSPNAKISGVASANFAYSTIYYDGGESNVKVTSLYSYTDGIGNKTTFNIGNPNAYPFGVNVNYPDQSTKQYLSEYCLPVTLGPNVSYGCYSKPLHYMFPTSYVDGRGVNHLYSYDFIGRLATRRNPDGDVLSYTRDGNGNVTQIQNQPKPGSTLPTLVSSWGYTPCTSANYKWCNKPVYQIDENGNRTDFQYDNNSGEITVELKSAASNNMRPVTRYYYGQFSYANITNPQGVFPLSVSSPPTIYLLTEKDECLTSNVMRTTIDFTYVCGAGNRRRDLYNYVPSAASNQTGYELISKVEDADNVAATTTYTYDSIGNIISTTAPNGNTSYTTYDVLRRKVYEIGASPGSGNPRQVVHHVYDGDSNEIRTEFGAGTKTDGSDFTLLHHKQMTYDANDRLLITQEMVP